MPFIQLCDKTKHKFTDENGDLVPFTPNIDVIANALCYINRYTGHVGAYSVAQHSLHVFAEMQKLLPDDYEMQLAALLHDATEAYLNDISKPLKDLLPDYRAIEDFYVGIIDEHFNINTGHDMIKMIDKRILKTEGESFGLELVANEYPHLSSYDYMIAIAPSPDDVFKKFMLAYYHLINEIEKRAMH